MKSCLKSSLLVLVVFRMQVGVSYGQSTHVLGSAFDLTSNQLLYREVHCEPDEFKQKVYYFDPDGALLVDKILDFNSGAETPSFVQSNRRSNEVITVLRDGRELSLARGSEAKTFSVNGSALVIDAGFDSYIRTNWQALIDGDRLKFRFPLVSRNRLVTLRISSQQCVKENENSYCFRLEPANWIIRKLADPIALVYDNERRLMRYSGVSNIEDTNGEGMTVDIKYVYLKKPHPECVFPDIEALGSYVGSTGSSL